MILVIFCLLGYIYHLSRKQFELLDSNNYFYRRDLVFFVEFVQYFSVKKDREYLWIKLGTFHFFFLNVLAAVMGQRNAFDFMCDE